MQVSATLGLKMREATFALKPRYLEALPLKVLSQVMTEIPAQGILLLCITHLPKRPKRKSE